MGLFGKLTEKKECGICGKELGLLGKSKVEDGYICKDCRGKLSPFFDERRHTTLADIQSQLDEREANKERVQNFHPTRELGDRWKLLIDDELEAIVVTDASDWHGENADVIDFENVTGADVRVEENRHELTYVQDGKTQHYNPPRFEEDYGFYLTVRTKVPYIPKIEVKLNDWDVKDRFGPEYDRYERMAAEMRDALRNLGAGGRGASAPQGWQQPQQAGYGQQPQQMTAQQQPVAAQAPVTSKFCPNCGAPTTGGSFCESCGSKLV